MFISIWKALLIQFIKSLFTHNLISALVYRQIVCSTIHFGSGVYTSCVLDYSLLLQRGHKLCPRPFILAVVAWTQVVYSTINLALACTQVVYSTIHYCSVCFHVLLQIYENLHCRFSKLLIHSRKPT